MVSEGIKQMTNEDLATVLQNYGVRVGPITETTRSVYERKLVSIYQNISRFPDVAGDFIGSVTLIPLQNSISMVSEEIKQMTNEDLATALKSCGVRVGPITDTTRVVYERKLARVRQEMLQEPTPAEEEEEEEEEEEKEEILSGSVRNAATSERLTSVYQRYTSPLVSKISGGNNPPSYIGTPGSSRLNTSLTRRPLSSMREEVKFTSLRNTQATSGSSASDSKKKGVSIIIKLFILIVFGIIAWLIYMNFESPAAKPLLNTDH